MSRATGRHSRPKKLNPKQNVQIFRDDQVESLLDYDSARAAIETGVEKGEEAEYHLQQSLKASEALKTDAKVKDAYIPTPPTIASGVKYDLLYPKGFSQPATYIRSSATVEDCAGVAYCMDEEDDVALKTMNAKFPAGQDPVTEDQFEEVMNFFEETAQTRQPFAAVDSPPVLSLEELEEHFDDTIPEYVRQLSKYLYEHWKSRRTTTSNRGLMPRLKFETGQENDDLDPYVCFRRRELRQTRKTRNRDQQSAEKLRKLRMELETARNMLLMVKRREVLREEALRIDRQVFEQRVAFRDTKRKLGLKGDDELLINQKKQKLPPGMSPNQAAQLQQLRMPMPGGPGPELRTLEEVTAVREREIQKEIQSNIDKHIRWNEGFVDRTLAPLTPDIEEDEPAADTHFREAMAATEYLPTPPASISDTEQQGDGEDAVMKDVPSNSVTPFRYASPADEDDIGRMPSFRRRIGRGGRIMIDRRIPHRHKTTVDDRFKFDSDDEDNNDPESAEDWDYGRMIQRAYLFGASTARTTDPHSQRRPQIEAGGPSQSSPTVPPSAQTVPTAS